MIHVEDDKNNRNDFNGSTLTISKVVSSKK